MKVSVVGAAGIVGVSRFTLRALVRQRRIPFYRVGRRIVLDEDEIKAWLATRRVPPAGDEHGASER